MRVAVAAAVAGTAGLALLLLESIRALTGSSLNTLATILLFLGLGLVVVCAVLAVLPLWRTAAEAPPATEQRAM